jgi:hypothetical protein
MADHPGMSDCLYRVRPVIQAIFTTACGGHLPMGNWPATYPSA